MPITAPITPHPFPNPLPLRKLLGPSFIILALGLGSGEVILWPYLSANYGLGIVWGAILGITLQYFINMEIERYALARGESVFVGIHRLWPRLTYWFIGSTFLGFGLPGIISAAAHAITHVLGFGEPRWLAVVLLIGIGLILSSGKTIYGVLERMTMTIILIGVPFIFILALVLSGPEIWQSLLAGVAGYGPGYRWLPGGISIATFLAAFAYSGAGGNLNLTQSIYIKEKGYGMGVHAQKIAGLFKGAGGHQHVKLTGHDFTLTEENLGKFKKWWHNIALEHALVFWLIGALSMVLLMTLSYATAYGDAGNAQGINFVITEGIKIGLATMPLIGTLFLIVVGIMLFQTQLGVMDSTSRIMAENAALIKLGHHREGLVNLSGMYFTFLWAQIAFGVTLFLLDISEPRTLIVLGAVINAIAMFVHIGLVTLMNWHLLPKVLQPSIFRRSMVIVAFIFFGCFSAFVVWDNLLKHVVNQFLN